MNLWTELLALCLYGPALVLLHELGHAMFARRGGYRVTSFGVGLGKPLWHGYLKDGVVLHIDRWLLAGGACTAIPLGPPTARRAWFHAGGLIVQAGLAAILWFVPDVWWIDRVEQFNVLVALTNGLPWRTGGQASDGWHLMDALAGSVRTGHVVGQRAHLQRMLQRELAVDSAVGVAYCDVCLAWSEVQLGLLESAGERIAVEDPQVTREPWIGALYHVVLAEWHRANGRALASIRATRAGRALEGLEGDARALLDIAEARALVDVGAPDKAQTVLARLVGATGLVGNQAAACLLHASLDGPTPELELAVWRVERHALEGWLDPVDAVLALRRAADELDERGRVAAARGARASAETLFDRSSSGLGIRVKAWMRARLEPTRASEADLGF